MFSALIESTDWTFQIPAQQQTNIWQQSRIFATNWGRWNAYLNQLCLDTCLAWLQSEHLPTATVGMAPALWEIVTGSVVTVGNLRIALIPTETIDRSELTIPQEWVDIPTWAADYYLGVQVSADCRSISIYGYATHKQIKAQADYDAQERNYCLDIDDLIPDLNALWLSFYRYTTDRTRAPLTDLPTLDPAQAEQLITRLANPDVIMARLEVPFATWGALLANPQWHQKLCQQRQAANSPRLFTQLSNWLTGQIDTAWQSLDQVLLPPQVAIAVRSAASQSTIDISFEGIYRAKIFDLDRSQIMLVMGILPVSETESRISLQVHPAGGEIYLPGETHLRLLSIDGSEIGKVSAAVTETIQLQFRAGAGEQFEIEITCCGHTLMERFQG